MVGRASAELAIAIDSDAASIETSITFMSEAHVYPAGCGCPEGWRHQLTMPVHPPRAADLVDVLTQRSYQAFKHVRSHPPNCIDA